MGHYFRLVDIREMYSAGGGGANLFPEHLDDPQKTFSLGGVRVAGISIGLQARA